MGTVLITGANIGLGLELASQYAELGWRVLATYRGAAASASLQAIAQRHSTVQLTSMDVTQQSEVRAVAEAWRTVPIDVLINNAGVYCEPDGSFATQTIGAFRFGLLERVMAVNVMGPLLTSEAFLSNLQAASGRRIVCISSTNGSLTQPFPGGGAVFYRASKAALNRAMQVVAEDLRVYRIGVLLIHPGMVRTERFFLYREQRRDSSPVGSESVESEVAVREMIRTIERAEYEDRARFLLYDGTPLPW